MGAGLDRNAYPWPMFDCYHRPDGSHTQIYNASLNTTAVAQFTFQQRRLHVQGTFFDDIVYVSLAKVDENVNGKHVRDLINNWIDTAVGDDDVYVAGGTATKAFQYTICADLRWTDNNDLVRGESITWPDSATGEKWWAPFELSPIVKPITRYRRLIKASTAYLGIASYDTVPGDIICVFFGSSTPKVLRPVDGHFLLVGECSVHGIMDGEAMEGVNLERESRTFESW